MQQQLKQATGSMSVSSCLVVSIGVGGNKQDGRMSFVHNIFSLFFMRKGDKTGRNKQDILHGRVLKEGLRQAIHLVVLCSIGRGKDSS